MLLPSRARAALRRAASPEAWVWVLPNLVLGLFVVALFALLGAVVSSRHDPVAEDAVLDRYNGDG
jgi:hypothetical protein